MKKGFTLVELSIALVIIGLLIGGSIQATKAMRDRSKVIETQQKFEALKEMLYGFALNTGTLPATQAQFNTLASTPRDAWGNPILYRADAALVANSCSPTPSTSTTSGNFVQSDIAFILVSRGKDYSTVQTVLGLDTPLFNQGDHDANPATLEYDDRFLSITRAQLQNNISCLPFSIVNPSLHSWNAAAGAYAAQIIPQGGTGYTYALTANPAGMTINATGMINWATPTVGTHPVTVRVAVGVTWVTRTYALVINP
jgi:prepilin-type N-terminal cleavage/methylation domain-containing protein